MLIGTFERKLVIILYQYWNDRSFLTERINKAQFIKNKNFDPSDISNEFETKFPSMSLFTAHSLRNLCIHLRLIKFTGKKKKDDKTYTKFNRDIDRLYSAKYIQDNDKQLNLTDKGILAATDKFWIYTILRENREWLLSLIISIIALIISIISLLLNDIFCSN